MPDDALVQFDIEAQQFRDLALQQFADGNAGPARDDLGDVFFVDFFFEQPLVACAKRRFLVFERAFELAELTVFESRCGRVVGVLRRTIDLELRRLDLLAQRAQRLYGVLLVLPTRFEAVGFLVQFGELRFEFFQSRARRAVALAAQRLAFDFQLHDAPRRLVEFRRHRVDLGAQLGSGFVDQINRLVG